MISNSDTLLNDIRNVLNGPGTRDDKLLGVCSLLKEERQLYDWVGFYLVDTERPETLILGPFDGEPTDHTVIPFGRGICGQSAVTQKPLIIDDVTAESNYLACSLKVKSEIVMPVFKDGEYVAQLDIDSHTPSSFTGDDEQLLSAVCDLVSALF